MKRKNLPICGAIIIILLLLIAIIVVPAIQKMDTDSSPQATDTNSNDTKIDENTSISAPDTASPDKTADVDIDSITDSPVIEDSASSDNAADSISPKDQKWERPFEYFQVDPDAQSEQFAALDSQTKLPIVHITTRNDASIVSLDEYMDCLVNVFSCEESQILSNCGAGIRVRGNSTAYYGDVQQILDKFAPYRIKFNEKQSMLGLNDNAKCKSWVLLMSNWNLIMDHTAFELADAIMGDDYYHSDSRFVYLYINDEFAGIYLLCEQNQVNKNRVNIAETPADYEGTDTGYFVEMNNYAMDDGDYFIVDYDHAILTDPHGTTREAVPAEYSYKSDIYSQAQMDFISTYVNNVYKIMLEAVQNKNYLTISEDNRLIRAPYENAYDTINAVADLDSIVDMYILYEIVHDYDCGEGSFFMCVDFSENSTCRRLTFTAPWDFNWAYNDEAENRYWAAGFCTEQFAQQYGDRSNPWFILLMDTDWFQELVKTKWASCYGQGSIDHALDGIYTLLDTCYNDLDVNNEDRVECAYTLLDWVCKRVRWLDSEWGR